VPLPLMPDGTATEIRGLHNRWQIRRTAALALDSKRNHDMRLTITAMCV
jgi:hypothetical protein